MPEVMKTKSRMIEFLDFIDKKISIPVKFVHRWKPTKLFLDLTFFFVLQNFKVYDSLSFCQNGVCVTKPQAPTSSLICNLKLIPGVFKTKERFIEFNFS